MLPNTTLLGSTAPSALCTPFRMPVSVEQTARVVRHGSVRVRCSPGLWPRYLYREVTTRSQIVRALASAILARIAAREDVLTTPTTRQFSEFPSQVGQHAGDFPKGGPHMFLGDAGRSLG
jgi:hypothetical protein